MVLGEKIYLDNEFIIVTEIIDNKRISQYESPRKLGLSLDTINVFEDYRPTLL